MTAIKALIRELEKAFVIVQRRVILAPADEVCGVGEFEEAAFIADTAILDGIRAPGGVWIVVLCVPGAAFAGV
jgi:hypothetical protein